MKKKYSLKGRELFKEVNIRGRKYQGSFFKFSVIRRRSGDKTPEPPADENEYVKIGIIVPKKYGNAVKRNLAKRRVRAVSRPVIPLIKRGTLIIIKIEENMKHAGIDELEGEFKYLIKKSGVLCDESVI